MLGVAPLTPAAFQPFGDVIAPDGAPDRMINAGLCGRFHDRARLDFGPQGRACLSLFQAEPRALPYTLTLLERHPMGSQAFIPMAADPYLVIVAPDAGDRPGSPRAFLAGPGQAINFLRGTWHGVLTPLAPPGLFMVLDREGPGANLDEYFLPEPVVITSA